jgi:cell wall-associated NlpC family hydrolase
MGHMTGSLPNRRPSGVRKFAQTAMLTPQRAALVAMGLLLLAPVAIAAPTAEPTADKTAPAMARAEKTLRDIGGKAKDTASEITSYALSLIGVDYKFGGNTPDQGLDCSGLIRYVFQQATGLSLPRTAREQARVGQSVAIDKLQPGDLVFFNTRRFQFSHVGLYVGDNRFIHAPSRGGSVEVVNLDQRYWQKAFNGARRVVSGLPDLSAIIPAAEAATPMTAPPAMPAPSPAPQTSSPGAIGQSGTRTTGEF